MNSDSLKILIDSFNFSSEEQVYNLLSNLTKFMDLRSSYINYLSKPWKSDEMEDFSTCCKELFDIFIQKNNIDCKDLFLVANETKLMVCSKDFYLHQENFKKFLFDFLCIKKAISSDENLEDIQEAFDDNLVEFDFLVFPELSEDEENEIIEKTNILLKVNNEISEEDLV